MGLSVFKDWTVHVLISSAVFAAACGAKPDKAEPVKRGSSYVAPALNEKQKVTLFTMKAEGQPLTSEEYQKTCLYLNESFRSLNFCSLKVSRGSFALFGKVAGQNRAVFTKTRAGSQISEKQVSEGSVRIDWLEKKEIHVGDHWSLKFEDDRDVEYEIEFEILRFDDDAIEIEYFVKSYKDKTV